MCGSLGFRVQGSGFRAWDAASKAIGEAQVRIAHY